ncbi:MAG: GTPase ObgE [Deltaproteobacteria bacterium]|nr:GTPase ObgE [Deltaproteobacteria bacterium]
MRFIDEVTIQVQAGDGGKGCVAFRRESHVPKGGPSGGDGGRGGAVVFVADPGMSTLLDLKYQRSYRAASGEHGQGRDRFGHAGDDLVVRVPCGTLVYDLAGGELLADLVTAGQTFVAARGGRGGHGNMHYATSTNQAPRRADPGEPGECRELRLELKLLAEVGLVGLPNAGKSTLISRVSAARPKVADYPFTTLVPNLGVVGLSDERSFVMADIPGLIEGASQGAGLGHRFLKHIHRTRVVVFLLDDRRALYGEPGTPLDDLAVLRGELSAHAEELAARPALVVLNKVDLLAPERREELARDFSAAGERVHTLSGVTGEGLPALLEAIWALLVKVRSEEPPAS